MGTLLDPAGRMRGGIKWALVAHTVAMFSSVTVYTVITLVLQPVSYVDNREFPNGPLIYEYSVTTKTALFAVPNFMLPLNQWLADGLLVSPALNSVALGV